MTVISKIVQNAFRESNIIALGVQPTDPQATEALELYNALIQSLYGGEAGERISDWPLGTFNAPTDYYFPISEANRQHPEPNSRLIALNTVPVTTFLPDRPQDGARMAIADPYGRLAAFPVTLDARGRTIEGAATLLLNTNGQFTEWFYRADLAGWVKLTDLLLTDQNPFPAYFDMMFEIMLGMRINPRYGRTLDAQSVAMLKQSKQEFTARYLQSAPLEALDDISWPFMSRLGVQSDRAFSSTAAFQRGEYWRG